MTIDLGGVQEMNGLLELVDIEIRERRIDG